MKLQIVVEDVGGGNVRLGFKPPVERVLESIKRTGKWSAAEEAYLTAFEALTKRSAKNKQARTSSIIMPN